MLPPKDPKDAQERIRQMEAYYGDLFAQMRKVEQIYDGDVEGLVALPEGYDLTIPATASAIVEEAVDNIAPHDFLVTYAPRGGGDKPQSDADSIKRFSKGLVNHWRRKGNDLDPIRDFLKNLFLHGKACFKVIPDWTLWPTMDEDEEKKLMDEGGKGAVREAVKEIKRLRTNHTPLILRSLSPMMIMEDPTVMSGRKLWFIERYEGDTSEVQAFYADYDQTFKEYTVAGRHTIHEVWTATYTNRKGNIVRGKHWIFIDHVLVNIDPEDQENSYGDLPYIVKYSGFGRETYKGTPTKKSVGFFTPQIVSLLLAEIRRFSQFDAIMAQAAFPIFVLPDDVSDEDFDNTPGTTNYLPKAVIELSDKFFIKTPIPDSEYLKSLGAIGAQIERGTTQVPLRGAPVPGTDSAAQLGQYTSQAKLRLESCQQAGEDALSEAVSRVLMHIDVDFKSKVSVFVAEEKTDRYTIGPENIRGRYVVDIQFMPNEELIKERKLALASDAVVKASMSPYDALSYAGFDNAQELVERGIAWKVINDPLVIRALGKEYAQDLGIDVDEIALEEQKTQGKMAMALKAFMEAIQSGSMPGIGDPMSPNGDPNTNQDPLAALAQAGQGAMPLPLGAQPQDPALAAPAAGQQTLL